MSVGIITVGDELLTGFIDDTNGSWLGRELTIIGRAPVWHLSIGDSTESIKAALNSVPEHVRELIVTGGLGPTHDDITLKTITEVYGAELEFDQVYWEELTERFARRGFKIGAINRNQALVPAGHSIIPNPVGSARGAIFKSERYRLFLLPGVPAEMKAMFNATILPLIKPASFNGKIRVIRTAGNIESHLAEKLTDLYNSYPTVSVASLPRLGGVDIRLISNDRTAVNDLESKIIERAGDYIYGFDADELENVVGSFLTKQKLTIATAESCTGGLISHRLTQVPGSSNYMLGGVVAYSNAVKMEQLGVPEKTLIEHGAVSSQTAIAMAEGVRQNLGADIGISSTGIAGPGGGSKAKPVGLVYFGFASPQQSFTRKFQFIYDRKINKAMSSQIALNIVRLELENA